MREVQLELMRPDQIIAEKERCSIAYLAAGPLEWHGPQSPFGTDGLAAYDAAKRCARQVGGVVLPPLFIGVERERTPQDLANMGFDDTNQYILGMDFPDNSVPSYYFREDIFAMVMREYVRLMVKQGYKMVVIVNGHGAAGQIQTSHRIAAEFNGETDTRVVVGFPIGTLGFEGEDPGHASRAETASMMALTDSVDLSLLPPMGEPIYMAKTGIADGSAFAGNANADFSVTDDPRLATKEMGERYLAAGAATLAQLVVKEWAQLNQDK